MMTDLEKSKFNPLQTMEMEYEKKSSKVTPETNNRTIRVGKLVEDSLVEQESYSDSQNGKNWKQHYSLESVSDKNPELKAFQEMMNYKKTIGKLSLFILSYSN